jgi:hypothetical protein
MSQWIDHERRRFLTVAAAELAMMGSVEAQFSQGESLDPPTIRPGDCDGHNGAVGENEARGQDRRPDDVGFRLGFLLIGLELVRAYLFRVTLCDRREAFEEQLPMLASRDHG